jgi:6-phosphogluconate dehydrogenase
MIVIVTGVSGSGKTTIGTLLSKKVHLPFFDADDFHPAANVEKMSRGIALSDQDRSPWLKNLAEHIQDWERHGGAILACSALKESYRQILQTVSQVIWVHLQGEKSLISQRLQERKNHYMNPDLLTSQLETWEEPDYGLHLDIDQTPQALVEQIIHYCFQIPPQAHIGIIGMGVMGKSLALNLANKGVPTAVYNRYVPEKEVKIASKFIKAHSDYPLLSGYDELSDFLAALESPKKILLMIPAGEAIDLQIEQLLPHLQSGDIIIDGGNSFFEDSGRRSSYLGSKSIHFIPMGVSGGEEGARNGPSLMPGGDQFAYEKISPYLKKIAAADQNGKPCVTYVGPAGSGHFIKMVHNSIEYAEMQALAETTLLLKHGLKLNNKEISNLYKNWLDEGLKSYLLEITANIFAIKEDKEFLVDKILDKAGHKGTGNWSITTAMKYQVPYSPLAEAATARTISSYKEDRVEMSRLYKHSFRAFAGDKVLLMDKVKNAYTLTRIINHEVGFELIAKVSNAENWNLNLSEIARIWTSGCIIRSSLMEQLSLLFLKGNSLMKDKIMISKIKELKNDLTFIVGLGLQHDYALPVMSASANYLFGRVIAESSANILQAQRDYFGAHTYQLKGDASEQFYHTDWISLQHKNI